MLVPIAVSEELKQTDTIAPYILDIDSERVTAEEH